MKKIAIYARVSIDKQESENQLIELRKFCTKQEWTIYNEFIDVVSGGKSKEDREQMKALFKDASQGRFDTVLFYSLDRFSREGVLPTLSYLNQLESYGVHFKSFAEQYLDSTGIFKDAVISILATIARQEKIRIAERTKAGLERAKSQGKILGRPKVSINAEQIIKLKEQGKTYREMGTMLGISIGKISDILHCS